MSRFRQITKRASALLRLFRELLGIRRAVAVLLSAMCVSGIEVIGLVLIFPYIKLITDPTFFSSTRLYVDRLLPSEWFATHGEFVVVVGVLLIAFYLVKGVVHSLLIHYQANVAANLNSAGSISLVDSALKARYQLFVKHGGVKIAAVSYSNTTHAALLFQSVVAACNELVLLAVVFGSLFVFSPLYTSYLLIAIGILGAGFFVPFSRRISKIGRESQTVDLMRHRFVFAMASAIKDIKIMGLEPSFMSRNAMVVQNHVRLTASYQSITASLRIAIEALLACGVVGVCMWLGKSGQNFEQIAPILGTIGMVAVRLAPALSRLVGAYNGFRYSLPFVDGLLEMRTEVARFPQPRTTQLASLPGTLAAESVSFSYGDRKVLDDVSITIPRGQVVGVVGPSGSGKSTLLDLLAGLQPASSGRFSIDGVNFTPFESDDFCHRIGYVPQSITLLDASLEFNICLEEKPDPKRLAEATRKAHLDEFIESLGEGLNTELGEGGQGVSGGQRQRIGIARALYRRPELLILDEVTSALDSETEAHVMRELLELRGQTSLLIVTHRMQTVADADLVYRLEAGKIIDSPTTFGNSQLRPAEKDPR